MNEEDYFYIKSDKSAGKIIKTNKNQKKTNKNNQTQYETNTKTIISIKFVSSENKLIQRKTINKSCE